MAKAATIDAPAAPRPAEDEFEIALPADDAERTVRLQEDEEPPEQADAPEAKQDAPLPEAKKEPEKTEDLEAKRLAAEQDATQARARAETAEREAQAQKARAIEDRTKRKEYARKFETVQQELAHAREQLARAKGTPASDGRAEAYWKGRVAELKGKADQATEFGQVAELTLNAFWEEQERRERLWQRRLANTEYAMGVALSQLHSRLRHPDYDKVLRDSGVEAGLKLDATGNWTDPVIGRLIYLTRDGDLRDDPAERAWEVAEALLRGKEAYEALVAEEAQPPTKESPAPQAVAPAAAPASVPTPEPKAEPTKAAEAEAEARGARRVIEQVEANAKRPQGIRHIRSAGTPGRGLITFQELDRLADENPGELDRILRANPDLERRWLGG